MVVQFILGRSGTGKSSYCIDSIAKALQEPEDRQKLIFLVPEQATYQAERAILSNKQLSGYHSPNPSQPVVLNKTQGLNVLSFDRLQYLLLGKNTARPRLSKIGRQMVISRILAEHKSRLKLFSQSAAFAGFSRQLAQTIAELQAYAKQPEDIDELIAALQKDEFARFSALKFTDIALILREYLQFVQGRFLDPEMQLNLARRTVAGSQFFDGAKIWVDGFAGFTTSELAILTELLKKASEAHIALCLDPKEVNLKKPLGGTALKLGLFNPTQKTYADILEIVKACRLNLAEPVILTDALRFNNSAALGHIEKNIFEANADKISAKEALNVVVAPDRRAEVRFTAGKIVELVRRNGLRYRDIAVIAADLSSYEHYVRAYFKDYNIPFFIDSRQSLRHHPAVTFLSSALRAAAGGFANSDVFEYLKSGLVPIDSFDVDLLENYCLAFGITGRDWMNTAKWNFDDDKEPLFNEEHINKIRNRAIQPLIKLRDKLSSGKDNKPAKISPEQFTKIIFSFLDDMQFNRTIQTLIDEAIERKDFTAADEHRQFYEGLVDIFDELCEAFSGFKLSCDVYISIIEDAFSQLSLALIPPALDEVLIGSIERSRHPDLKAVFLIGTTQKDFPMPVSFSGILTDEDRLAAEAARFELAASTAKDLLQRQYLAYIAFTRPSEFLCISYPAVDEKARPVVRSQFIDDIESLFDDVSEKPVASHDWSVSLDDSTPIDIDRIYTQSELADFLCMRAGSDGQITTIIEQLCEDDQFAETASFVRKALEYDNKAQLDKAVSKQLFGPVLRSSASRLSTFAQCPYKYFARYVLALAERVESKFEPLDIGRFYHQVLDKVLKELKESSEDFATVSNERLIEVLKQVIAQIVESDSFLKGFCRHSKHNTYIVASACEVLQDFLPAVLRMVRAGQFRPVLSELWFGGEEDESEFKIILSGKRIVSLTGRIDRIDVTKTDAGCSAVIFDYKRSFAAFSWSRFYHGLDMQLPIYMLAVRNSNLPALAGCDIAGAFYIPVETKLRPPEKQSKDSFNYKSSGLFNGEFAFLLDSQAAANSKFYNFYVTKDGSPYGSYNNRGALKPEDFQKTLRYCEKKITEIARAIVTGCIDIRPFKLGSASACTFCEYKSVCRFDWQLNDYNFLQPKTKLDVLGEV
jgi:ATP-dependent helicase/nuclease subunit B